MDMLIATVLYAVFIGLPIYLSVRNFKITFGKDSAFRKNKAEEEAHKETEETPVTETDTESISLDFKPAEDAQPDNDLARFETKPKGTALLDVFTLLFGLLCTYLLYGVTTNISVVDYDTAVYVGQLHSPFHTQYSGTLVWIMAFSYVALIILCVFKPEKLSPVVSASSIAFTLIGLVCLAFIFIQLRINIFTALYFLNVLLIAVRRIHFHITEHVRLAKERDTQFRSKFAEKLYKLISKISGMTALSFLLVFPACALLEIIFILTGQGPDGFIKAFTMTADWTFSTQIPPPPIEYEGHYLCTVASGGHRKIVKPIRYGNRLGSKIIVNRQLLTANAFEDLIKVRLPHFHKAVRGFYDKFGYPLSRHITTKSRADLVYLLMKPLELIFIITLYTFDTNPENRIAVQYSDYNYKNHILNT